MKTTMKINCLLLAFALIAIGPVVLIALIVTAFPETARRSLEELNPEDRAPREPPEKQGESLG